MRFDKLYLSILLGLLIFSFRQPNVFGQEELIEESDNPPNVDGMFEEGLEPLDDAQISRPVKPPSRSPAEDLNEENSRERVENQVDDEMDREFSPIRRPDSFSRPSTTRPSSRPSTSGSANGRIFPNYASDIPNSNEKLRMDFVQVEIEEVVKYFAERLRKKFIYDPSVLSGKVTIISPTDVTVAEAYQAFLSAMEIRGYVVFPSGAYFKIEKVAEARKSPVPLYLDDSPSDDSYVTRIITLKYLNVGDIRRAVQDLVTRSGGDVIEHAPTNTLIISDYANNIKRIVRILSILDVEGFQEQVAVIPLKYSSASDVARKISEIFPTGTSSGTTRSTVRSRTTASSDRGVLSKVVADDRTNSLIILGSDRGIEQVKKFIDQIDIPIEGGDGQIHVYQLQNQKAEDLSQTLASLTQSARTSTRTSSATRVRRPTTTAPKGAAGASESASLFDGDVKVTADQRTNSLVIQASPRDFEVLKGIIQQLDIRRRQVFIESVILETKVGGLSEFGTNLRGPLFRTDKMGKGDSTNGTPKSTGAFGLGGITPSTLTSTLEGLLGSTAITGLALGFQSGGTIGVPVPDGKGGTETRQVPLLTAVLRMAATNSHVNVLSTPHILATANEEASLSIGEEIPQIASTQQGSGGNAVATYNRIRVATELSITPQINAGDYLTLKIQQKVNERGEEVVTGSGQFATTTREATTTSIVKDGQTIVIGGIMRDRKSESMTKVPFLGDIPILGWLFKSRNSNTEKINLLLFITPHIIRDTGDMNDVFFKKLREREGFLQGLGMKEAAGVPISGYSPEQLDFLDEEYVKSLRLEPLPTELPPEAKGEIPPGENIPAAMSKEPEAFPSVEERKDYPTVPVAPRSIEPSPDFGSSDPEEEPPALEAIPPMESLSPPEPDISLPPMEELQPLENPQQEEDLPELDIPDLEELPSNPDRNKDTMDIETKSL
ncbi:MAG: type II secretion system protein GspD [Deltaproteobacteria bacterium CG11_big_fil_rev_8_21_14_0_20_45_16]|nr:MAG: type II secretion system protein GspD [Deltaproteobacteria bacterium CG11_big_fil_rev_8_21_14_0_20_45_16]